MAAKKKTQDKQVEEITILRMTQNQATFCLKGVSPLVFNRLPKKAREQLLLPPKKVKGASRELTLKHDPYAEFLDSPYTTQNEDAPTLLVMPGEAFKKAVANATLDMEDGPTKASIGRLVGVVTPWVSIYGIPTLWMTMVRQAGQNKTPDVRTRAVVEKWAAVVTVSYISPNLSEHKIGNLMANAGIIIGVGDGRQEKGSLSCGKWDLASKADAEFNDIIKTGGRSRQMKEMGDPHFFDEPSEELFEWFEEEAQRREFKFLRRKEAS